MKSNSVNILLVDDHKLFRKAMTMLLTSFQINAEIFEAANGKDALEAMGNNKIDVILLDVQMPIFGGMETLKQIRKRKMHSKVIMLTQHEDKILIRSAIELGANSFLLKGCDPEELKQTILDVASKGHSYSDHIVSALSDGFSQQKGNVPTLEITNRELQMLALMKDGSSAKEIAKSLNLKLSTIESYRKKLLKKTGTRNTTDLVSMAYRTGMLNG